MHNHSLRKFNVPRPVFVCLLSIIMMLGLAHTTRAQMFSVDDPDRSFNNHPTSEVFVGFEPTSVSYHGSADAEDAGQFSYDAPILRVGYSSRSLNLFLAAGGEITGSENAAYFDVGGNINFGLPLYVNKKVIIQLPLRISSRLTNITNDRTSVNLDRFRFGGVTGGAGLQINVRPKTNIRFQAAAVPSYGFTFASGGLFGGSLGTLAVNGRLFFDRLFGDMGLSLGYKYDFRNYNVDEQKYDYRVNGHSIQVGLTF